MIFEISYRVISPFVSRARRIMVATVVIENYEHVVRLMHTHLHVVGVGREAVYFIKISNPPAIGLPSYVLFMSSGVWAICYVRM